MTGSARHPGKRLSPWRVLTGILVLLCALGAAAGVPLYLSATAPVAQAPAGPRWFGPYFDVTAAHTLSAGLDDSVGEAVLLSFVVAEDAGSCVPTWGAAHDLADAGSELDLDRRVDRMRRSGTHVAVSFGGALNVELASACDTASSLEAAYADVLDRYGVSTMDLDLEGRNLTDTAAGERRAEAVAELQRKRALHGAELDVWVTLPVGLDGLTADGITALEILLDGGVELAGVNAMTMNYGVDLNGASMAEASRSALQATHDQLTDLYAHRRIALPPEDGAWAIMGATPMIGQNELAAESFTLADAARVNAFANDKRMARMSIWSVNRDRACGPNYPDLSVVSDACSGVEQLPGDFSAALGAGFDAAPAAAVGEPEPLEIVPDDPQTSPYPIWSPDRAYSTGVRVVWHGYVYSAKWWVRGGPEPDDPLASAEQTAWVLLGAVSPDDEPFRLPTAPSGTYPQWVAGHPYQTGDRVLFDGTPYRAKWWTQGDLPSDGIFDRERSPWDVLQESGG